MRFIGGPFRGCHVPDHLTPPAGSDGRTLEFTLHGSMGYYAGGVWHNTKPLSKLPHACTAVVNKDNQ